MALVKVAEHCFGSLLVYMSFAKSWQEKGCGLKAETWQVKNIYTEYIHLIFKIR